MIPMGRNPEARRAGYPHALTARYVDQPGMTADIVAMRGDYLADATALRHMAFVMKGGRVFKYQP